VDPCGTDSKQRSPLHLAAAKGNERLGRFRDITVTKSAFPMLYKLSRIQHDKRKSV